MTEAACEGGAATTTWVYVGGMDFFWDDEEVQHFLRLMAGRHGVVRSLRLEGFKEDALRQERRRRHQGKCHQGYALLQMTTEEEAAAVAAALEGLHTVGGRLKAQISNAIIQLSAARQAQADAAAAAAAAARERQREHNHRRHVLQRRAMDKRVGDILRALPAPGGLAAAASFGSLQAAAEGFERYNALFGVNWDAIPEAARPDAVLCERQQGPPPRSQRDRSPATVQRENAARRARKVLQIESFAAVLRALLAGGGGGACRACGAPLRIVDFGCGSGNLTLALGALFPEAEVTGVDMTARSVQMLEARAAAAGLRNVRGRCGLIEAFDGPLDVAVALHACGNATDHALLQATRARAAYVVCPCCIGKLKFSIAGGSSFCAAPRAYAAAAAPIDHVEHPRSGWMRAALGETAERDFGALARAADVPHGPGADVAGSRGWDEAGHGRVARLAKMNLELDRSEATREAGYATAALKLLDPGATAKSDLLVGAWAGAAGGGGGWCEECAARRRGWARAVEQLARLPAREAESGVAGACGEDGGESGLGEHDADAR